MAWVQLAKGNLKIVFVELTTSSGYAGYTWMSNCTDEELIKDYINTQSKMSNDMHKYILALKRVEKKYFSCWQLRKDTFKDKSILFYDREVTTSFSTVPTLN